jgi:hypothetical protein
MDYHSQSTWLKRLNIKREWLFSIIPASMVLFMLFYMLFLSIKNRRKSDSIYQELWRLFYWKMKKKGFNLSLVSLEESSQLILNLNDPTIHSIWEKLVALSFKEEIGSTQELKRMIKKI